MGRPVAAARRYAEAAFQVALAESQLDRWQADLAAAAAMLGRSDVEPTVHSPAVPLTERVEIVRQLLEPRIAPGPLLGRAYKHLLAVRMDQGPIGREAAIAALQAWWADQPESDTAT